MNLENKVSALLIVLIALGVVIYPIAYYSSVTTTDITIRAIVTSWTIEIFGIPVWISFWSILLGIYICFDAIEYIKEQIPKMSRKEYLLAGLVATILTLLSIGMHEFAHAIMAHWVGVRTVEAGFAGIFAYVIFETPIIQISPWKGIVIALAGPVMNFLIAAIALIPIKLWKESILENTVQYIAHINIRLGRLNLLPIFMLDGGKALHGFFRLLIGDSELARLLVSIVFISYVFYRISLREEQKPLEEHLENL